MDVGIKLPETPLLRYRMIYPPVDQSQWCSFMCRTHKRGLACFIFLKVFLDVQLLDELHTDQILFSYPGAWDRCKSLCPGVWRVCSKWRGKLQYPLKWQLSNGCMRIHCSWLYCIWKCSSLCASLLELGLLLSPITCASRPAGPGLLRDHCGWEAPISFV